MASKENEAFDIEAWAERRGIEKSPRRAGQVAELLGVTPHHARRIIEGQKKPSRTIILLAQMIERLAEIEAELARDRDLAAREAIEELEELGKTMTMRGDELLALTRGE